MDTPKWPGAYLTEDGTQWVLPGFSKWWRETQSSTSLTRLVDCPQFWEWWLRGSSNAHHAMGYDLIGQFIPFFNLDATREFYHQTLAKPCIPEIEWISTRGSADDWLEIFRGSGYKPYIAIDWAK